MLKLPAFAELVDKYLARVIILLLVFIIVLQACLAFVPGLGIYLNYALRLEGGPLAQEEISKMADGVSLTPWASINLRLCDFVSLPEATVLIDGKEVGSFLQNELTLNVKQGNILVINNPYPYPITVEIVKATPNIVKPKSKSQVSGTGRLYFVPVELEK